VEAAASLFGPSEEASKALVLITDGDNLDGDPSLATRIAIENHIRLFAVGVATPEGSTVPEAGSTGTSYKKDETGKIVMSRLGERLLLVMAKATDGRYFRSESINLDALTGALDQIRKKSISGGEYVEYEERYQSFLLMAFLLLFAGTLVSDRRGAWFPDAARPLRALAGLRPRGRTARTSSRLAVLLALAGLLGAARAGADVGSSMRRGLELESQGKLADAAKAYQEALVLEPDNVRIRYDLGRVLYGQQQFPRGGGSLPARAALQAEDAARPRALQSRQHAFQAGEAGRGDRRLLAGADPGPERPRREAESGAVLEDQAADAATPGLVEEAAAEPAPEPAAAAAATATSAGPGAAGAEGCDRQGTGGPHAAGPPEQGAREPEEAAETAPVRRAGREGLVRRPRVALAAAIVLAAFAGPAVFGGCPAFAGEIEFTASVDQTTVGLGEQFQLVLSVRGEDMLSAPQPELPAMPAIDVLGRSSSQSRTSRSSAGR
jgi:tetratricopeptide (TPR) repeat protein